MRIRKLLVFAAILAISSVLGACGQNSSALEDGYYTAEAASFDQYGWKEFITIYVSDGQIITVEYDSFNASGFVKSWDIEYMRTMKTVSGTYPKEYARVYSVSLINWQASEKVDAVTGATHSHTKFQMLAEAAVSQAKTGDKQVALVGLPE